MTPTLHVVDRAAQEQQPFAKVEGPTFFGGCLECCCNFDYPVSSFTAGDKTGDLAMVVKEKPHSIKGAMKELVGDSDTYSMEIRSQLTPQKRLTLLSSLFLLDYMLFEFDNGMCSVQQNKGLVINCCNVYCCGAVFPIQVCTGNGQ